MKEWINIADKIPASQYEVEVMDEFGNTGIGEPCYYPFRVGKSKTGAKWSSPLIHLDKEEHDGSWVILAAQDFLSPLKGSVVKWREL